MHRTDYVSWTEIFPAAPKMKKWNSSLDLPAFFVPIAIFAYTFTTNVAAAKEAN